MFQKFDSLMKMRKSLHQPQKVCPKANNYFFKFGLRETYDAKESFHYHVKPTLCLLRIMGAFPVAFKPSVAGLPEFKLLSPITVYSACFYIVLNTLTWSLLSDFYVEMKKFGGDLSDSMYIIMFMTFLVSNFWYPLLCWLDVTNTCQYFVNWRQFQIEFDAVTKDRIQLNIRKYSFRIFVATPISGGLVLLFFRFLTSAKIWKAPALMVAGIYFSNAVFLKMFMLAALHSAGSALFNAFKRALEKKPLSANLVEDYRLLWLRWSRLVSEEEFMFGSVYAFSLVSISCVVIIHLYCFLVDIRSRKLDAKRLFNTVAPWLNGTAILFLVCRNAHALSNLGNKFRKDLELIVPSTVSSNVWAEVKYFLNTIKINPPVVSAKGFTKVDKKLFLALMSATVTYMIVLLQFDEGDSITNSAIENSSSIAPLNSN